MYYICHISTLNCVELYFLLPQQNVSKTLVLLYMNREVIYTYKKSVSCSPCFQYFYDSYVYPLNRPTIWNDVYFYCRKVGVNTDTSKREAKKNKKLYTRSYTRTVIFNCLNILEILK